MSLETGVTRSRYIVLLFLLVNNTGNRAEAVEPILNLNDGVDERDLACAGCLAVVDVIEKAMAKKSFDGIESRIYDTLETVCDRKNFPSYDFIPPKMVATCKKLMDELDEEKFVALLMSHYKSKRPDRLVVERATCLKLSGSCVGSDRLKPKERSTKEKAEEKIKLDIEDKHFQDNVDDLMKKHGHKIKQPRPVKTEL